MLSADFANCERTCNYWAYKLRFPVRRKGKHTWLLFRGRCSWYLQVRFLPKIQWRRSGLLDRRKASLFATWLYWQVWPPNSKHCRHNTGNGWQEGMYVNRLRWRSAFWPFAWWWEYYLQKLFFALWTPSPTWIVSTSQLCLWGQKWYMATHWAAWGQKRIVLFVSISRALAKTWADLIWSNFLTCVCDVYF